jgi:hypothetical protein
MRKLSVFLIGLMSSAFAWFGASAQDPAAGVIWFQHRQFNIPFKKDQRDANVAQIRLYRSSDQGRNWSLIATAAPEDQHFHVNVPQDGSFWFGLQTVDKQNKTFPTSLEDLRPGMKLIVDTVPPVVSVQALQPRGGEVGVSWSVRDDNLDLSLPDAVRVEYRLVGAMTWIPLAAAPGSNQIYWNPRDTALVEVRVTARDRAGNIGQDKTTVSVAGGGAPPPVQGFNNPPAIDQGVKDIERKFVNSKQISLSYDLKEVGPSGVSAIELWYTLYKVRSWNKLTEYPADNAAGQPKKLAFEVQDEGIYGITLVAKSGVGLGDQPPKVGDRPQFWIEVDLTKPIVQIGNVIVGSGLDKGKLTVNWTAQDKNLGPNPVRLSYAEQKDGQWTPFAEKLGNSGRHVWRMPEQLPYQFYLKVEATDLAGNVGEAITQEKVKVDLSTPKANILKIEVGGQ